MCVVDETVEDCIGERGIPDDGVPVVEGELAGEERSSAAVTILEHLEQIPPLGISERGQAEVIEDEELGAGERP